MPDIFYHALNVGVVDRDKLHRVDLERLRLAAEEQTNLLCDAVGKAFLRPGLEHLGFSRNGSYQQLLSFSAGENQNYALSLTANALKILEGDAFVSRPAVSTTIPSPGFDDPAQWAMGGAAGTQEGISNSLLALRAFGRGARAKAYKVVGVSGADVGKEHGVRIVVFRGPVMVRIGSSQGGQDYIRETMLRTGYHSLGFIANGNFWIEFSTTRQTWAYVNECSIEPAGDVVLPTVWGEDDLQYIRTDQSLDVMFIACEGRKPQRIETRGNNSFSVCDYDSDDGPFSLVTAPIKLRPDVLEGQGNLFASLPFFTPDHLGAMFRLYHEGQRIDTSLAGNGEFTPTIMVTGINEPDYNERGWQYTISGSWSGTLVVQRSFDGDDVEFHNFRNASGGSAIGITGNVSANNDDNEDNAIAYYRIGFQPGSYGSGAPRIEMYYAGGGGYGIARVVQYISPTQVVIEIMRPFKGVAFTDNWREGAWSENVGWPTSNAFHEGRLFWAGYDAIWGSVSDAYDSFDEDFVGDAGPLLRSIALGGRNTSRWLASMSNLILATDGKIAAVRGSSLDEIMTPENFGIRAQDKVGAARVRPAMLSDERALFVEAEGQALYELTYASDKGKYKATEFSKLTNDLFTTGISSVAVTARPDQRIWLTTVASDTIAIVYQPDQNVIAHIPISLDAPTDLIESVISLPGDNGQDRVIMSVKRVVNGVATRRIERMARDRQAIPDTITRCLDAHRVFGPGNVTISLPHLIGRTVWAWVDGRYVEDASGAPVPFVVSGAGTITLPVVPASGGCAGLPYRGRYKSAKLEYGGGGSTSMMNKKVLSGIGLLLADYCRSGVKFGSEFDNSGHPLFNLPALIDGVPATSDIYKGVGVTEMVQPTDSKVSLDSRMCVEITKPCSILALVMAFEPRG